jgi:hypothetical protein
MSAFLDTLALTDDDDGVHMLLMMPLRYQSDRLKRELLVPAGFQTDFASVPRALWNVLPPHGRYDRAAVLHDFFYQTGGLDRGEADGVLLEAMNVCHVARWQRWTIYAGVRAGGWATWRKYRRRESTVS